MYVHQRVARLEILRHNNFCVIDGLIRFVIDRLFILPSASLQCSPA
jgi:hypothetical protein